MMTSDDVKKILVVIIVVLLCQLLIRLINVRRLKRGRQIAVSVLTPIVVLITVVVAYQNYDTYTINSLNDFFDGMVIVWNIIIVAVFAVYKLVFCPIANAIWGIQTVMSVTGDYCYIYNDDINVWFLKTSYTNMRKTANVLSWVTAGLSAFILSLDWIVGGESEWFVKVFPFAAMIIITELYNYLNGYTKPEFERSINGDEITSRTKGAYYKLRKVYESLFPTPLLVSHTGNEFSGQEGSYDLLVDMSKNGDSLQREVGDYFLHLDKKEGVFNTDLVKATENLRRGVNVVIHSPFYRDLTDYLLYPLVTTTIYDKKCLIISGRDNSKNDIKKWLNDSLYNYGKTKNLWRVETLDIYYKNCEVGIVSFSQLYDVRVLKANEDFFKEVGFVLIIEPSRMISTGQIGLCILSEYLNRDSIPTFCALDRDVDGLVDTLSHVFKIDITTVVAPPIPRSVYTVMGWDAKGDYKRQKMFNKETRYLGNGVELAAVALKNQVPKVEWYSSEKSPIDDIRWIAGQYYPAVTKYANLISQQHSIDDSIAFNTNLWGSTEKEEAFVIAEDEFCNIFEALRMYLSRGKIQSFVNVISENYLLRDYMRYNRQLFMTDAKAIPTICPGYSKTERNTIIKLILLMVINPIEEDVVRREFSLLDINNEDIYSTLVDGIYKYTDIKDTLITVRNRQLPGDDLLPERKREYYISPDTFVKHFSKTIKTGFFIVENEETGSEIIDAKLFGHITQIVMPNQIIVHNGKAYRVHKCTPELGCILHRASDLYTERLYYKQLRKYHLINSNGIISSRSAYDIGIVFESWNFDVETSGYLEMKDNDDLKSAKLVDFSDDPAISNYFRKYKNKTVLKIVLPDLNKDEKYTFAILLSELFRTLFPESCAYLAVLADVDYEENGLLHKYNYLVDGAIDKKAIYIVEDSEIDLGLLEAIDTNFIRILEIIEDYLEWHFMKIKEPPRKDPILDRIEIDDELFRVKEKFSEKVMRRFRKFFGIQDNETSGFIDAEKDIVNEMGEPKIEEVNLDPSSIENNDDITENHDLADEYEEKLDNIKIKISDNELNEDYSIYDDNDESNKVWKSYNKDKEHREDDVNVDVFIDESEKIKVKGEDKISTLEMLQNELELVMPIEPSRYQNECFLNFGFEEVDHNLKIERIKSFLSARCLGNNSLAKARRRKKFDDNILDFNAENFCDFCGKPLSGISYDVLADGRIRCNECSTSSIKDIKEFKSIYQKTEMMMENIFNVKYPVAIRIVTADARVIAKHSHSVYKPSKQIAVRTLGFAQYKSGEYSIFIENGCPRLVALNIISHEMTHIWQYINWDSRVLHNIYKQDNTIRDKVAQDLVYEGMAVWASIQIIYSMGETYFAEQLEQEYVIYGKDDKDEITVRRKDVYGYGYYLYRIRFGIESSGDVPLYSPFKSFPPLDPQKVREIVLELCPD